jgi:hypothetical protein
LCLTGLFVRQHLIDIAIVIVIDIDIDIDTN